MNNHEKLRGNIIDFLRRDLFGPYEGEREVLELGYDETPAKRYITGILFPRDSKFEIEKDYGPDGQESSTDTDDTEEGLMMSNSSYPSCFGISFACLEGVEKLDVKVKAGIYKKTIESDSKKNIWKRIELEWSDVVQTKEKFRIDVCTGLSLRLRARQRDNKGNIPITISLVNNHTVTSNDPSERSEKSFFQVYFSVEGSAIKAPFTDRKPSYGIASDPDTRSIQLLYGSSHSYAIGHGCAVDWKEENNGMASIIESSFVPHHSVYPLISPKTEGLQKFSIKKIIDSGPEQLANMFATIAQEYELWIKKQESMISSLPKNLRETAKKHINLCSESLSRINKGIKILCSEKAILKAFKLAHRAMLYQFAHSAWMKEGGPKDSIPEYDESHAWYPFQIAFILQCLESLSIPDSNERDIVDLLWFPTGGGKTEAYLGLVAFVLFLRRIRAAESGLDGGGTAVITRYTLRLLTLDQFYRTALLACSCEKVRIDPEEGLEGTAPVSVGLWVGKEACPNKLADAARTLIRMRNSEEIGFVDNPIKLRECPWCGTELGPADYEIKDETKGMIIRCPDQNPNISCPFSKGIPVWIIDEDVYREKPSIVIGTVDKFARLPWIKEAGYLFGTHGKTAPPELIIQDELHLISGPLGSLVGLYETAVDLLSKGKNRTGAKIIASTATIRNAQNQVNNLYARQVRQFPQPCLDYRDSFFSKEDIKASARIYAGVFAPSFSPTTALIRTFGCLLHGAKIMASPDDVRDAYWTLMGYFLSLRELGGARRHIEDDVHDYLEFCEKRDVDDKELQKPRIVNNLEELTSRVGSGDLDEIRKWLWTKYPDEGCLDTVLATNMISVGLDVPRLGLMAIAGQPKTTSEYIQASSRIGRRHPGLLVIIYKWTHSRDRSHYERFKTYHGRLYSEVEATSVTPFSARSRDRGLHAVLISLIRHLVKGMSEQDQAVNFSRDNPEILDLIRGINERIKKVDELEAEDAKAEIDKILSTWANLAEKCHNLYYRHYKNPSLLKSAEDKSKSDKSFPTMNSLRNIDQPVGLYLMES